MPGVARIGDVFKAVCCCHKSCKNVSGVIVSGSANVLANNISISFCSAVGKATCGHTAIIVSCSPNVLVNGIGCARLGDTVTGCPKGVIVSSSANVFANG